MCDVELKERVVETVKAATAVVIAKPLGIKVYPNARASEEDQEKAIEANYISHERMPSASGVA